MPEITAMVNFRVPPPLRERLRAQAFAEGLTISEVLRKAADNYLADREPIRRKGLETALETTTR
jgi:hypothetical protein